MELRQEGQQTTPRHCGGCGSPATERNDTTATTEESEVNHSDIFRLRSSIVEIVEDLKLRQAVEKENEERINQLLSEKHELERKLESEKLSQQAAEEKRQQEAIHNKQQCDDKIRTLEEEQKQFQILKNCAEKEMKAMKEEARELQLCKYRLDKRVKELEARLGTQERRWDTQHGQLTGLENKVAAVRKHFHRLEGSQSRLDKNVEEAVKLNRSLMSVNKHQHCVISQLRQDAASLRSQLVEARAAAQQAAGGGPHTLQERDQLSRLKVKVSTLEMEKTSIQRELDFCQEHLQATVSNLQTAEGLLQQHQQDGAHHQEELQDLQLQVQQLQQQCQDLRSRHQAATLELEEARAAGQEHEACWREKVQTAERERAAVAEQLTNTHSTLTRMEQEADRLNSRLQDTARKLAEAQALLNVERVSDLTQTDVSLFLTSSASVQTEVRQVSVSSQMSPMTSAVAVQTLMELQHASCQTLAVVTSSSHSQTYVAPVLSQLAQTWQAALSVVGTQTDLPADSPETARHASELKTPHQHRRPQQHGQADTHSSPSSSAGLAAVTTPPTTAITSPPITAITPRVSPAKSSPGVTPVTSQAARAAGLVAMGGVSDQVCSGVAMGGVSDQVCSGVAMGGVSDQVYSGVAMGGVSDQVRSGVAAMVGQSLVPGSGTEERRRGGMAETCPVGVLRDQLSSDGADRRRLPTVIAPHRRQSASRVAQQRQSASDAAQGSQPTSLVAQEGRSTTTGHEGQSTTIAHEGQSTTIAQEDQSTTIAQEGQSTTTTQEGQSTTVAYEGQSTTVTHEGQSSTIAQEGESASISIAQRGPQAPLSVQGDQPPSVTVATSPGNAAVPVQSGGPVSTWSGLPTRRTDSQRKGARPPPTEGAKHARHCPPAGLSSMDDVILSPSQSGCPHPRQGNEESTVSRPPTAFLLQSPSPPSLMITGMESARHVGSVTTTQSAVAPVSDVRDEPATRPQAAAGLAAGAAGRDRPGRPPSVRAPPSLCVPLSWACLQPVVTLTDVAGTAHHPPLGGARHGARRPGVDRAALCSAGAHNGPSGANGHSADTGNAGQRGKGGVPDAGCKSTVAHPSSFSSVFSSSSSSSSSAPLDPAASPAVGKWAGSRFLSLSLHSESRSGRSGGRPQGAEELASVSVSSSSSSCTSFGVAASSSAGRGVLKTAVSSTLSSPAAAWTVRSLGTKSRPLSRTTRPQSKYPVLQMSILPDRDHPKTPKTRKGILKGFQYTDNVKEKTVTFAPMKAKKNAEPVSSDVAPPSPSPGAMTADDQSLFSDADDNGTQDNTTSEIRRQCRRIVGLLEEHRDVTSTFSSRKRKLQD